MCPMFWLLFTNRSYSLFLLFSVEIYLGFFFSRKKNTLLWIEFTQILTLWSELERNVLLLYFCTLFKKSCVWNCLSPAQIWYWTVLGYRISILLINGVRIVHTSTGSSRVAHNAKRHISIVWQRLTSILLWITTKKPPAYDVNVTGRQAGNAIWRSCIHVSSAANILFILFSVFMFCSFLRLICVLSLLMLQSFRFSIAIHLLACD